MPQLKKDYIAVFAENKFEWLQLILLSWVKRRKIYVVVPGTSSRIIAALRHIPLIGSYLKGSIKEHKLYFSDYKGLWYEMNNDAINLTQEFYNQEIRDKSKIIAYYNRILNTNKFEPFIKKEISHQVFALLKNLHLLRLTPSGGKEILIIKNPINKFVVNYIEDRYRIGFRMKWIPPMWGLFSLSVYYRWLFLEFIRRGLVFNEDRKSYKISREAWGLYKTPIGDDVMIDNSRFKVKDVLMLMFAPSSRYRSRAFKEAKARGFDTASVSDLKININKNIFSLIFFYFIIPAKAYLRLLIGRHLYLFYHIFSFHKSAFPIEILMNLYRIDCYISTKDYGDVAETIIFNKYGTKNVIYHWSDLTSHKSYAHAFMAHNIYLVWGDIHYDYHSANYFVDKKVNIGCIYKEEYNKAIDNKENVIARIDRLKPQKKTVAFYNTSINNTADYTEHFFLDFLELIRRLCERNRDINVLLKPKKAEEWILASLRDNHKRYKKISRELSSFDNFIYLNNSRWSAEEIMAISDICVSMGMNTPATIALICGKNALYFDNTGNDWHPFAKKYKNAIVFEDEDFLLKQIDNILNGKFNCRDVISQQEIREYDAFADDSALERLRENLYELTLA